MLGRLLLQGEGLIKGLLFDCRRCGACALTSTRLICPMTCPKQLRNGPCGGTLHGRCEVHPDRACVWVRIQQRRHGQRVETPPLLPPPNPLLRDTPSYRNLLTGADQTSRTPLPPLPARESQEPRTASRLELALRGKAPVFTTELRAPRGISCQRLVEQGCALSQYFTAINATAYLAGAPSLPPGLVAGRLAEAGVEVIAQATARDHTATTFGGELLGLRSQGVRNLLCLTGDWSAQAQLGRQVYDGDSALLCRRARTADEDVAQPQRLFIGGAINPLSSPAQVPLRRLLQKIYAGAEFIQTQVLTETETFAQFWQGCLQQGLAQQVAMLPGIPVVTSLRALQHLEHIAGVEVDPDFAAEIRTGGDVASRGVDAAIRLGRALLAMPEIRGVHLMLFGADHQALVAVRQALSPIPVLARC